MLDYYEPHMVHFCEAITNGPSVTADLERLICLQEDVRNKYPEVKIIRSIPITVSGAGDFADSLKLARRFEPVTDLFLTDTLLSGKENAQSHEQPVHGFVGITGKTCDWETAADLVKTCSIPVILAGGISPENVFEGIRQVLPFGIDSCTQTNATDPAGNPIRFQKDREKVKNLVEAVRRAEKILSNS
jgi:phosphoribosylanthranilate isomerase